MLTVLGFCVFGLPYCIILSLILLKLTAAEGPHHVYLRALPHSRKPVPTYHLGSEDIEPTKQEVA